jgi:hypothetical protein
VVVVGAKYTIRSQVELEEHRERNREAVKRIGKQRLAESVWSTPPGKFRDGRHEFSGTDPFLTFAFGRAVDTDGLRSVSIAGTMRAGFAISNEPDSATECLELGGAKVDCRALPDHIETYNEA